MKNKEKKEFTREKNTQENDQGNARHEGTEKSRRTVMQKVLGSTNGTRGQRQDCVIWMGDVHSW